mmetsp:Transcript_85235/g.244743  ORF Transcript_85235/g.244743 Transcript_85235/m.244743 type:complete len:320 (+) Transcript_85235:89-1048(+)
MAPGGAVGKSRDDDLEAAYELLGVNEEADDKEIQGAFRKGSLKCHPDRNPDDPQAPEKFDRLQRAKELLLDPIRRAEFDRNRKAKHEQESRAAEEDSKRRKLREDLEVREGTHAAAQLAKTQAAAAEDSRKKYAQMDFAARIRAKEAELASKQAEVAAVVAKARQSSEEAKVRIKWREPGSSSSRIEAVKKALADFDVRTITLESDTEACVQVGSREDALRAVLTCRGMRQQLGFRVTLDQAKRPAGSGEESGPGVADGTSTTARPRLEPALVSGPSFPPPSAAPTPGNSAKGGFDDWEAQMLNSLKGLAEAQKAAKVQ